MPMVTLRAIEPEDLDLMYRIENDPTVWQHGSSRQPLSRYAMREFILQSQSDIFKDEQLRLTILSEGRAVGFLDLCQFSPLHQRAEVGIVVSAATRRRGIARQALLALMNYIKANLPIRIIYAVVAEGNEPALRLFPSAGFTHQALLPSWVVVGQQPTDAHLWVYQLPTPSAQLER